MGRRGGTGLIAALAASALAGAAAFAWGSLIERRLFTLREVTVPILPPGAEPIRVLHLSDLHMAPWQRDKQRWVAGLVDLKPDLVVSTGDNLGHEDGLVGIRRALETYRGIPGVQVHGSNDFYGPMRKSWFAYLKRHSGGVKKRKPDLDTAALDRFFGETLGWLDLNNAVGSMTVNGTVLDFFGVDDPHVHRDRLGLLTRLIDEQKDDQTLDTDDPGLSRHVSIGVAHAPYQRVLNAFVTHGAQLILAGHTHGGQVCIPGYGAVVTNCDIPRSKVKGLSVWTHALRSSFLNVSAGLGTSIYAPVRFACRPEATLLKLVAAQH
ncbi:Predicted phosphohydrolase, MPP superfamily [Paramicrobacterium humi]|uniref:Predicted phosphohydrolase, MPP superfamily n=1 Tax=Paramicrobacterium humi TaxID=640635 RepID=A0A1H4NK70_9MICO|nr:metallophosphoesterase [Microbacterium humi]SEB94942.1 Predicted phosphohydrolase, MPP superfamily [Microbacterium humi]